MGAIVDRLQHRLIPALLAAMGVSLIAAGLLTYTDPIAATPPSQEPPTTASGTPGPSALLTFPPLASPSPSTSASPGVTPGAGHVATRVVVPALDIDLPVIKQPGGPKDFPPCNVAMYHESFKQPGEKGATYLYAHARTGMFLPILTASKVNNGKRMLGMLIQVYTSDDRLYLYEVVEVRRHILSFDGALAEKRETLWLQTSEGLRLPNDQVGPKVQLIAIPLSNGPADHKDAHPKVNIVYCQ